MTDMQQPTGQPTGEHDNSGWVILGVILVIAGFFLGAHNLGLIPWQLRETWQWFGRARGGIGVLLVGIALIIWAQSGRRISMPHTSGKLMRSRSDKWVSGVLGGLGAHFGVDSTILRLAFIALVVLFDIGGLVIAYIVMAIVVPLEPHQAVQAPTAPVAYAPPAPPVPVAPPVPAPAPEPTVPAPAPTDPPVATPGADQAQSLASASAADPAVPAEPAQPAPPAPPVSG